MSQDLNKIEKLVKQKAALGGLDLLAIWCAGDPKPYEMAVRVCESLGITPYLWFPVLADIDAFKITKRQSVHLFDGSLGNGRSGRWEGQGSEEDFLFLCPNEDALVNRNLEYFTKLLDTFPFKGVMLDRIRYPSFANGLEALYTCFCSECASKFGENPSLVEIKDSVKDKLESTASIKKISDIEAFVFDENLKPLFDFRKRNIERVVSRFAKVARNRQLKVGLDLFSPSLAGCVGQDYETLSNHCDWIKPMLYCHAMGPAGLPLETKCLLEGMGQDVDPAALLSNILEHEIDAISGMSLGEVGVYPGIEAIDDETVGLKITPKIIRDYLDQIKSRFDGIIASWNILQCSNENLRELRQIKI